MIRTYCDESYKEGRIYVLAGYTGKDRDWKRLSTEWRNRRLQDGINCFHAADCEDGRGEFEHLSKERRTRLKADLIAIVNKYPVYGFGVAIAVDDFWKVRESHPRGKGVLGPDPYFLCFQMLITAVTIQLDAENPGVRTSYVFDRKEEVSGRAKHLFSAVRANSPDFTRRMGGAAYADRRKVIPLEIADNLAYEVMKDIFNRRYDPTRPRRKSMNAMIKRILTLKYFEEPFLRDLATLGNTRDGS